MKADELKSDVLESYRPARKSLRIFCFGEGLNTHLQIQDQRSLCFGCEYDTNPKEKIDVKRRVVLFFIEFFEEAKIKNLDV